MKSGKTPHRKIRSVRPEEKKNFVPKKRAASRRKTGNLHNEKLISFPPKNDCGAR